MRTIAIGDPQAPFETFLAILKRHGLLASAARLADDVHLVSLGDHFDYGSRALRAESGENGRRLLGWLADQPPSHVTLLLGNHDVSRVQELADVDDATFAEAQRQADLVYVDGHSEPLAEAAFIARFPFAPTAELIARDYSTFRVAQRDLVTQLLREKRFRLAHAHAGVLLCHAGVTKGDVGNLGLAPTSAAACAQGLNAFLDSRLAEWHHGPLSLAPLQVPGTAASGEGRGVLYHRPSDPGGPDAKHPLHFEGPPRRRFDPRTLPSSFSQVIGHIRDRKCRELMPDWSDDTVPPRDGVLRSLTLDGQAARYRHGVDPAARLIFADGGMAHTPVETYQLFDVDRFAAALLG